MLCCCWLSAILFKPKSMQFTYVLWLRKERTENMIAAKSTIAGSLNFWNSKQMWCGANNRAIVNIYLLFYSWIDLYTKSKKNYCRQTCTIETKTNHQSNFFLFKCSLIFQFRVTLNDFYFVDLLIFFLFILFCLHFHIRLCIFDVIGSIHF